MSLLLRTLLVLLLAGCLRVFGYKVDYDSRAIRIDGQRTLFLGGSLQYCTTSTRYWDTLLQKAKSTGFNFITVDVPWRLHEPNVSGQYDFGKTASATKVQPDTTRRDIATFLALARKHDLKVHLRIGPILRRWRSGSTVNDGGVWGLDGVPRWTLQVFSSDLVAVSAEKYIIRLMQHLQSFLPKSNGPVFMIHIEGLRPQNTAQLVQKLSNNDGVDSGGVLFSVSPSHLSAISKDVVDRVVPVADPAYYVESTSNLADKPLLWGGLLLGSPTLKWGESHARRLVEDSTLAALQWIANGGSLISFDSFYSGSDGLYGAGGQMDATNQDSNNLLDAYMIERPVLHSHISRLVQQLKSIQHSLLASAPAASDSGKEVSADSKVVTFDNNSNSTSSSSSISIAINKGESKSTSVTLSNNQQLSMSPWSAVIYSSKDKQVVFNTSNVSRAVSLAKHVGYVEVPGDFGVTTPSLYRPSVEYRREPVPASVLEVANVDYVPRDQVSLANNQINSDYSWYVIRTRMPALADVNQVELKVELRRESWEFSDILHVFADGTYRRTVYGIDANKHGHLVIPLRGGDIQPNEIHSIQILAINVGDGSPAVEGNSRYHRGIGQRFLISGHDYTTSIWCTSVGLVGERKSWYSGAFGEHEQVGPTAAVRDKDIAWQPAPYPSVPVNERLIWYRISFQIPRHVLANNGGRDHPLPLALDMSSMTKGLIFVNGHSIGRYWLKSSPESKGCQPQSCTYIGRFDGKSKCQRTCGQPTQRYYPIDPAYLKIEDGQTNTVTIFEEIGGDPRMIHLLKRVSY
ncbi:hypothetical protein GQ42DRAFT_162832 [Ramicandelaber brevisporus]|nr:hypothetical protein GQ42DRAFT_162832 [Ramicandelaber brevisporus]